MSTLFSPLEIGAISLQSRIVMAPLTRSRSEQPGGVPGDLMVDYYSQRASKGGLIISEASSVSAKSAGWHGAPGFYSDSVVQQPMTSLEEDVAATNRILDRQSGSTVLVGHSYGGAIITEAGNNSHVSALVYVAAFAPDEGEQVGPLSGTKPPAATSIAPTSDGYLLIDPARFASDFAADLPPAEAQFIAISQMPTNSKAFSTPIKAPAWKTKPSFGIVATQDRMINPDLERSMYARAHAMVTEVKGSHAIFISQSRAVVNIV